MTITAKAFLAYFVVVLIVFAWMFRYDVKVGQLSYVTDRWTGRVYYIPCSDQSCTQIFPKFSN